MDYTVLTQLNGEKMKSLNVVALFVLALGVKAQADQAITSDLPNVVLTCQESQSGAVVLDGAKTLTVSRDQFGQKTLTVVQKDESNGNTNLIENLPLTQKACQGYLLCESYEADQGATQLFVNFLPGMKPLDGHLTSPTAGAVDFVCHN